MNLWELAVLAFVAMVLADIISVGQTQAEARGRANLAGILDTVGYFAGLVTTFLAIDSLNGNDMTKKIAIIGAVSVANYLGSWMGVKIGEKYIKVQAPEAEIVVTEKPQPAVRRPGLIKKTKQG